MKRVALALLSSMLLVLPSMAQHSGGGHGGHGGGRGGAPSGDASADRQVVQDLHRAMAIQASELQVAQFKSAAKSTQDARKKAQEFQQHTVGADDLSAQTKALKDAVDQATSQDADFIKTFSSVQKSELKDLVKKFNKADAEVSKLSKELNDPGRKGAGQHMPETLDRLDKALTNLQKQQGDLAAEMGIQS
jgi:hypothetical protein